MTIFSKKMSLRLNAGSISDVGDFYAIGGQVVNKSLVGNAASTVHINQQGPSICIKGPAEDLSSTTSFSYHPGQHAAVSAGKLVPYFDSILGVTAGNRYFAAMNTGTSTDPNIVQVLADGTSTIPFRTSSATVTTAEVNASPILSYSGRAFIFAENSTTFFLVVLMGSYEVAGQDVGATCIVAVDKSAKTVLSLLGTAGSQLMAASYTTVYEGIFNGYAIFTYTTKVLMGNGTGYTQEIGYFSINISAGTIVKKTCGANLGVYVGMLGQASSTHSKLVQAPWDATSQCSYMVGSKGTGASVADVLTIYKTTYPFNIQSTDTLSTANVVKMTIAGSPPDFTYGHTTFDAAYRLKTFAFNSGGITYILANRHYNYYTGGGSTYPIGKFWLFQVSTDGTTATWLQTVDMDREYSTFLPTVDGMTIIAARYSDGIRAYRFDPGSSRIVVSETYGRPLLTSLGVDDTNTVFLKYIDASSVSGSSLEIININNSAVLAATFQNNPSSLSYTGTPLIQNVLLNSYDMFGTRLVRSIILYLEGCTFSDGSTAQTFTTSASADVIVPVTISASGIVNITPEFA